jgi:hypothetical protein
MSPTLILDTCVLVAGLRSSLEAPHVLRGESAWVAEAVREKLSTCAELECLEDRAARGSQEAFARVLAKVPAVEPILGDER